MWEPRPATCGPCGSPSVITYKRKGRYVEQTNACPACGWAYGGPVHVLGNLVRWADGAPEAEEYPRDHAPEQPSRASSVRIAPQFSKTQAAILVNLYEPIEEATS